MHHLSYKNISLNSKPLSRNRQGSMLWLQNRRRAPKRQSGPCRTVRIFQSSTGLSVKYTFAICTTYERTVCQAPLSPIIADSTAHTSIGRVTRARLLSPVVDFTSFDYILPMLVHIQNVLTNNEQEDGNRQRQVDRARNRLVAWTPEMCGFRLQLSNNGREIAFDTFLNLVVICATFEQALQQLQPRHRHRRLSVRD